VTAPSAAMLARRDQMCRRGRKAPYWSAMGVRFAAKLATSIVRVRRGVLPSGAPVPVALNLAPSLRFLICSSRSP
jgi:hypothetical protein